MLYRYINSLINFYDKKSIFQRSIKNVVYTIITTCSQVQLFFLKYVLKLFFRFLCINQINSSLINVYIKI